jgi:hypothetical protein
MEVLRFGMSRRWRLPFEFIKKRNVKSLRRTFGALLRKESEKQTKSR